jgi:hypothetical protein
MIQGCRYLRRSTDRWTLSKNSTTRLEDSNVWRKAGLLWKISRLQFHTSRIHIYTLSWYDSWWTTSTIFDTEFIAQVRMLIHPFVPSARATSPRNPAKSTQTVPLPNGSKLPTASSSAKSFWRNLPSLDGIFLPSWAHKSDSLLYQILVLTYAPSITG